MNYVCICKLNGCIDCIDMSNLISHDDYRPDYSYYQSQHFVDLQHVIVIQLTNTPDVCHIKFLLLSWEE